MLRLGVILVFLPCVAFPAEKDPQPMLLEGLSCFEGTLKLQLPGSPKEYRSLGKVARHTAKRTTDYFHGASTKSPHVRHTFEFDGLTVSTIFIEGKPKSQLIEVARFSHSRWNRHTGIKVGEPIEKLFERASGTRPSASPALFCGSLIGEPDCARVAFVRGQITEVQYECFWD